MVNVSFSWLLSNWNEPGIIADRLIRITAQVPLTSGETLLFNKYGWINFSSSVCFRAAAICRGKDKETIFIQEEAQSPQRDKKRVKRELEWALCIHLASLSLDVSVRGVRWIKRRCRSWWGGEDVRLLLFISALCLLDVLYCPFDFSCVGLSW